MISLAADSDLMHNYMRVVEACFADVVIAENIESHLETLERKLGQVYGINGVQVEDAVNVCVNRIIHNEAIHE